MAGRRYMDVAEFRRLGFLQEINRQLLHPCGLALEVVIGPDGSEQFGGIWDERDDPEGIVYGPDMIDPEKVERVAAQVAKHATHRVRLLGDVIQTVEGV